MKTLKLLAVSMFAGAVSCSSPMIGARSSAVTVAPGATDSTAAAAPIVQIREFSHSTVVSVVAWDVDDAAFGLRTAVTRNGTVVGGERFGDHRLYLTSLRAREMGGFKFAADRPGHRLLDAGVQKDVYSCFYGPDCSPIVTLGVSIPDSLLRANQDGLVVTFTPRVGDEWTITVRRELIAAFLTKVDSLVAEMRGDRASSIKH